jgi:hypothetical protein
MELGAATHLFDVVGRETVTVGELAGRREAFAEEVKGVARGR